MTFSLPVYFRGGMTFASVCVADGVLHVGPSHCQTDEQLEEARTFLKKRSEEMKEFKKSGKESKNVEDILLLEVNKKEKVFTTLGVPELSCLPDFFFLLPSWTPLVGVSL